MKKVLALAVGVGLTATSAMAQYTGSFTQTWNFDDGTQGWTLGGNASWNSTGGVGGGGAIMTPDVSWAELPVLLPLNGRADGRPFVLQADVFVPNLSNFIQDLGIQAYRAGDNKGPQVAGSNAGNMGITAYDGTWDNSNHRQSWVFEDTTARDLWHTLQIDYGYTTPGKWSAYILLNGSGWWGTGPLWRTIVADRDVNPDPLPAGLTTLRIGAVTQARYGGAWGQARFDNVQFVPEPTALALLGLGSVVLFRRRRIA